VAKLAAAADLKSAGVALRMGSSPFSPMCLTDGAVQIIVPPAYKIRAGKPVRDFVLQGIGNGESSKPTNTEKEKAHRVTRTRGKRRAAKKRSRRP
jgi:hypothetical protein